MTIHFPANGTIVPAALLTTPLTNFRPFGSGQPPAPDAIKSSPQFVVWRLETRPGDPKPTKVPYNPANAQRASTTAPGTWGTYDDACRAMEAGGYSGIGFVFTPDDPWIFIDLDGCRDPATGEITEAAKGFLAAFPGAWEISQSGTGIHIVAATADKGALFDRRNKWSLGDGKHCEFYMQGRFMAMGGGQWQGNASSVIPTPMIKAMVPQRLAGDDEAPPDDWRDEAREGYSGPANDDELLERMSNDKRPGAMFGTSVAFAELWSAGPKLAQFFPSETDEFDHSAADLALMNLLAFYTGCNPVRMERLFSMSKLGKREKWVKRQAYRTSTIYKAIKDPNRQYLNRDKFLQQRRDHQIQRNIEIGDDPLDPAISPILTLQQMEADLILVGHGGAVVHRPSGRIRNKDDARIEYAASKHSIETGKIDKEGEPKTKLVPAFGLWIESPTRSIVDVLVWDPSQPQIAKAIEAGNAGSRAYNTWRGLKILPPPLNWSDWAQSFLEHIKYLVPVEAERTRFLMWLAHIFQKPAELPHTAYLMVAQSTGIGRGTLASMLTRALRGSVASNVQLSKLLGGGFNGRLSQKLLATVDEIREGHSGNRYQSAEVLKSMITEENRHINPKYGVETVERNCTRWLMFSNHMDAIPFDHSDRRIIVIENPSYRAGEPWFQHLHGMMDNPMFIASIQQYFLTLDISNFRPGEHAPINAAKQTALAALEGDADRAAREFRSIWPGDLATTADLLNHIGDDAPQKMAQKHLIERAGMATAKKIKIDGRSETILIVRGPYVRADLDATANTAIVNLIRTARNAWKLQP